MPLSRGLLKIRFNQDYGKSCSMCYMAALHASPTGCFICSMESGVQIYNVEPLAEKGTIGRITAVVIISQVFVCMVDHPYRYSVPGIKTRTDICYQTLHHHEHSKFGVCVWVWASEL